MADTTVSGAAWGGAGSSSRLASSLRTRLDDAQARMTAGLPAGAPAIAACSPFHKCCPPELPMEDAGPPDPPLQPRGEQPGRCEGRASRRVRGLAAACCYSCAGRTAPRYARCGLSRRALRRCASHAARGQHPVIWGMAACRVGSVPAPPLRRCARCPRDAGRRRRRAAWPLARRWRQAWECRCERCWRPHAPALPPLASTLARQGQCAARTARTRLLALAARRLPLVLRAGAGADAMMLRSRALPWASPSVRRTPAALRQAS
jgi:hypothetical protein